MRGYRARRPFGNRLDAARCGADLDCEGGNVGFTEDAFQRAEWDRGELQHFIECVRAHSTPVVSGESAKKALDLALEISRQIKDAKQVQMVEQ